MSVYCPTLYPLIVWTLLWTTPVYMHTYIHTYISTPGVDYVLLDTHTHTLVSAIQFVSV